MTHRDRIDLAFQSLKGISIGDAFGESFFGETDEILECIYHKQIPNTTWDFTDDTIMSIAVFEQLFKNRTIIQSELIKHFVYNHNLDLNRGYGATARRILREIDEGENWEVVSKRVFEGMGSMGNGASMRVGPIGAYFFDDLETVKDLALRSAEVTHTNIEGKTGAVAVAIATALATQIRLKKAVYNPIQFIEKIVAFLPDTDVKAKINKSISIPISYHTDTLKSILGNGSKIMVQDTVPFVIWCAAYHLEDFENALWKAVSVLGDRDTICAMVGGITILSSKELVPELWLNQVEKVETSPFLNVKLEEKYGVGNQ